MIYILMGTIAVLFIASLVARRFVGWQCGFLVFTPTWITVASVVLGAVELFLLGYWLIAYEII